MYVASVMVVPAAAHILGGDHAVVVVIAERPDLAGRGVPLGDRVAFAIVRYVHVPVESVS